MSYREKIAWLSLLTMALTFGPYFVIASIWTRQNGNALPGVHFLTLLGVTATIQVVALGLGYWYLRRKAPLDARTPPDERDRAIERRSFALAYYVLMVGMVVVGVVMPFNAGGWDLINTALFAIVTAEVLHNVSVVTSYRRQS